MLDILAILLIFFILQTEFKQQVNVLKLDIPQTAYLSGEEGDRNSVLLEIGADGSIALGGKVLTIDQLPGSVQKIQKQSLETRVLISTAEGTPMGLFIEVLDTLAATGIKVDEVPIHIQHQH